MNENEQNSSSAYDLKNLLSGSVYLITLALIIAFILTSLSEFLTRF